MTPEIDQDLFNRNLLLTQAYCELQLQKPFESNAKVLRTINPEVNGEPIFSLDKKIYSHTAFGGKIWREDPLLGSEYLYKDLFERQLIHKNQILDKVDSPKDFKGKVLVAEIGNVIRDGISADDSDYFIDENDCPPIDTWFYMTYGKYGLLLFAWIPEQFIETVQSATEVNMLNIFNWYNDGAFFEHRYY